MSDLDVDVIADWVDQHAGVTLDNWPRGMLSIGDTLTALRPAVETFGRYMNEFAWVLAEVQATLDEDERRRRARLRRMHHLYRMRRVR